MKDAVIPQVRVETELRASLDAVRRPGETLTDFVEVAVRNAVEYRRVQTDLAGVYRRPLLGRLPRSRRAGVATVALPGEFARLLRRDAPTSSSEMSFRQRWILRLRAG
jgi:hypothetical protein